MSAATIVCCSAMTLESTDLSWALFWSTTSHQTHPPYIRCVCMCVCALDAECVLYVCVKCRTKFGASSLLVLL